VPLLRSPKIFSTRVMWCVCNALQSVGTLYYGMADASS